MPWNVKTSAALIGLAALVGCAAPGPGRDYSAYRQSNPKSILVLPPLNESPDVRSVYSVYSVVTEPLAESGYYVFPVAMVDQTFKDNGLSNPPEIHEVAPAKLHQIFGADAILYLVITKYGTTYSILDSRNEVAVQARLVDARSGALLWDGSAHASDGGSGGNGRNGLVTALIKQVISDATDGARQQARQASHQLLSARRDGLLYGPRSPKYGQDKAPASR